MTTLPEWHILRETGGKEVTDAGGRKLIITDKQLAELTSSYTPGLHDAPVVIGHPATDDPAYGWVDSLKHKSGKLTAKIRDLAPALEDLIRAGHYRKLSAALYGPPHPNNPTPGKWHLRHVGVLGAVPPVIKGLQMLALADDQVEHLYMIETEASVTGERRSGPAETLRAERLASLVAREAELAEREAELAERAAELAEGEREARDCEDDRLREWVAKEQLRTALPNHCAQNLFQLIKGLRDNNVTLDMSEDPDAAQAYYFADDFTRVSAADFIRSTIESRPDALGVSKVNH